MSKPTPELGKSWRCVLCDEIHQGDHPEICKSCERDGPFVDIELDRLKGRKKDGQHDCYSCLWLGNPQCPNQDARPSSSACDQFLGAPVKYNRTTPLRIKEHVFKKVEDYSPSGFACFRSKYTISEAEKGEGNLPIYIVSPGKETVQLGDQELCLAPIEIDEDGGVEIVGDTPPSKPSEWRGIAKIAKEWNRRLDTEGENGKSYKSTKELWHELVEAHKEEPLFYKQVAPISLEEIESVEDFDALLNLTLTDGLKKDPLIPYLFRGHIPIVDPNRIHSEHYMQFAPNDFIVAPTKTAKSSTARRVGRVYERPSVGGLLGFATADKKHNGVLHGEVYSVSIDEIGEAVGGDEEVAKGLSSYLELGKVSIPRGLGITVQGHASLIFMCNPEVRDSTGLCQVDYLDQCRDTLNKLTHNYQALGSRLDMIIFRSNDKMIPRSGTPVNTETQKRLRAFIQTIQHTYKGAFTSLFYDTHILAWLYDPMPQHYIEQLDRFIKSASTPFEIRELIEGHKEAIKHMRGMALRQSWMDYLSTYIKTKEIDENEIIEAANSHLDRIFRENLISFQEITSAFSGSIKRSYYEGLIDHLQPEYNAILIRCVIDYWRDKQDSEQSLIPIESLHDYYVQIRSDDSPYNSFRKLIDALVKNKSKVNQEVRRFGLHLIELGNDSFGIRILDSTFLNEFTGKTGSIGKGFDEDKHGNDENPQGTSTKITIITSQEDEFTGKTGSIGSGDETKKEKIETPIIDQNTIVERLTQNWDDIKGTERCKEADYTFLISRTLKQLAKEFDISDGYELDSLKARITEALDHLIVEGKIPVRTPTPTPTPTPNGNGQLSELIKKTAKKVSKDPEWQTFYKSLHKVNNHVAPNGSPRDEDKFFSDILNEAPDLKAESEPKARRIVHELFLKFKEEGHL